MSRENVEAWGRAIRAFNVRDVDGVIAEFDPRVEFKPLIAGITDVPYRGEQGVRSRTELAALLAGPNRPGVGSPGR